MKESRLREIEHVLSGEDDPGTMWFVETVEALVAHVRELHEAVGWQEPSPYTRRMVAIASAAFPLSIGTGMVLGPRGATGFTGPVYYGPTGPVGMSSGRIIPPPKPAEPKPKAPDPPPTNETILAPTPWDSEIDRLIRENRDRIGKI